MVPADLAGLYRRSLTGEGCFIDGSQTEVRGEGLSEETAVVVGEAVRTAAASDTTNPFTPQFFRGSGQGQRQ